MSSCALTAEHGGGRANMGCNRSVMDTHWHTLSHEAAALAGSKHCAVQKPRLRGRSAVAVQDQITSHIVFGDGRNATCPAK